MLSEFRILLFVRSCLDQIVDKPWAKQVAPDGTAGYLKRDGVTHGWWWDEYNTWHLQRSKEAETDDDAEHTVQTMEYYTDSGKLRDTPVMQALGAQVQAFANNKKPGKSAAKKEEHVECTQPAAEC